MEPCDFIRKPYDEKSFPDLVRILTPFLPEKKKDPPLTKEEFGRILMKSAQTLSDPERLARNNNRLIKRHARQIDKYADKVIMSQEGRWFIENLLIDDENAVEVCRAEVCQVTTNFYPSSYVPSNRYRVPGQRGARYTPSQHLTTLTLRGLPVLRQITVPGNLTPEEGDQIEIYLNLGVEAKKAVEGDALALLREINRRKTGTKRVIPREHALTWFEWTLTLGELKRNVRKGRTGADLDSSSPAEFYLKREPLPSEHPYKLVKLDGAGRPVRTWDYSVK